MNGCMRGFFAAIEGHWSRGEMEQDVARFAGIQGRLTGKCDTAALFSLLRVQIEEFQAHSRVMEPLPPTGTSTVSSTYLLDLSRDEKQRQPLCKSDALIKGANDK